MAKLRRERWIAVIVCDKWRVEQLCDDKDKAIGYITAKKKDAHNKPGSYGIILSTEIIHMKEVENNAENHSKPKRISYL